VLLDAAEATRDSLPGAVVNPWLLAELQAVVDVIRRWKQKPDWKEIEPSFEDPNQFRHMIIMLYLAEHLEKNGFTVGVVPTGGCAIPDLKFRATGGTADWVFVECYQPNILSGNSAAIIEEQAQKIVNRSMRKAKRQLSGDSPGMLAIGGYNQSQVNMELLRKAVKERLQTTSRPNLWGFALVALNVLWRPGRDESSFNSIIQVKFVPNPSYFGRVVFEVKTPEDDPTLIKDTLTDVNTDSLISGNLDN
jgi:hypothetical protein